MLGPLNGPGPKLGPRTWSCTGEARQGIFRAETALLQNYRFGLWPARPDTARTPSYATDLVAAEGDLLQGSVLLQGGLAIGLHAGSSYGVTSLLETCNWSQRASPGQDAVAKLEAIIVALTSYDASYKSVGNGGPLGYLRGPRKRASADRQNSV